MTSDQSYRSAIGTEDARAELKRNAGTQFDAGVVQALLAVLDRDSERASTLSAAWTANLSGPLRAGSL